MVCPVLICVAITLLPTLAAATDTNAAPEKKAVRICGNYCGPGWCDERSVIEVSSCWLAFGWKPTKTVTATSLLEF
jgi:hypothetical protein